MTSRNQKHLALLGAFVVLGLILAANAHLLTRALSSQPACVAVDSASAPAKRVC